LAKLPSERVIWLSYYGNDKVVVHTNDGVEEEQREAKDEDEEGGDQEEGAATCQHQLLSAHQ
jgi:hypothetical protein